MGAFRNTLVRRSDSHALGSMPALLPRRYTFSPISIGSISIAAPASFRIDRVVSMISGPMPSPWATVMGTLVVIRKIFQYRTFGPGLGQPDSQKGLGAPTRINRLWPVTILTAIAGRIASRESSE